jgi:hypothetical protein
MPYEDIQNDYNDNSDTEVTNNNDIYNMYMVQQILVKHDAYLDMAKANLALERDVLEQLRTKL